MGDFSFHSDTDYDDDDDDDNDDAIQVAITILLKLWQKRREKVCQNMHIETPNNSYADILQRLVRRYLFKLERQKEEGMASSYRVPLLTA